MFFKIVNSYKKSGHIFGRILYFPYRKYGQYLFFFKLRKYYSYFDVNYADHFLDEFKYLRNIILFSFKVDENFFKFP